MVVTRMSRSILEKVRTSMSTRDLRSECNSNELLSSLDDFSDNESRSEEECDNDLCMIMLGDIRSKYSEVSETRYTARNAFDSNPTSLMTQSEVFFATTFENDNTKASSQNESQRSNSQIEKHEIKKANSGLSSPNSKQKDPLHLSREKSFRQNPEKSFGQMPKSPTDQRPALPYGQRSRRRLLQKDKSRSTCSPEKQEKENNEICQQNLETRKNVENKSQDENRLSSLLSDIKMCCDSNDIHATSKGPVRHHEPLKRESSITNWNRECSKRGNSRVRISVIDHKRLERLERRSFRTLNATGKSSFEKATQNGKIDHDIGTLDSFLKINKRNNLPEKAEFNARVA